ncbi:hypothetical protein [Roseomonas sp. 18066]|uniref:hypothetical protein n=1 Tax=Roseomonas sp. 18066 TaxID=2681412 RepID=UPI00135A78C4|nr:hypothetical protein [Roseomonas sp. 18066]
MTSSSAAQRQAIQRAFDELQRWDAAVSRLTKHYATAKVALSADPQNAAAGRAFRLQGEELMQAMTERSRREKALARLRERFHLGN